MTRLNSETAPAAQPVQAKHACPECGGVVILTPRARPRIFCSEPCKQTHANRCATRGKALVKVSMGWRVVRGAGKLGKFMFQEMTNMLDQFAAEDHAAGRMRADRYAALVASFNETNPQWSSKYIDRAVRR